MAIFLLITLLVTFVGMKAAKPGEFHKDYISINQTTSINGLFTLLVFWSHVCTYISLDGSFDKPYTVFKSYLLQMVVVPFLFYSGYGIMESIKKKGTAYVKDIPKNRFFKVLLHLDIAVVLFLIVNFVFGKTYPVKRILLSFIGYSAVGNSNWYIFAVLGLYAVVFIAFMIARKNNILGVILATMLSVGFVYAQILLKRDSWCYDTIILFPVGMIFSIVKEPLEKLITKHDCIYFTAFGLAFLAYTLFYFKRDDGIEFYSMWGILFMALVVLATMKVKIGNGILDFFGSHVFSVYILQRIPMIILSKLGLAASHKYVFVVLCFVCTVVMAVLFDFFTGKLDSLLFKKRIKEAH
ncbi:MAG: hypothetical protein IJN68_03075 [Clostridia bacterium]|nr:hypothetical protein [Clostridia bacterium]